jgi:hypothetical protein
MAYRLQELLGVEVLIQQHVHRDSIFLPRTFVGIPCGFELVADLEPERSRLGQLASANPGEYFVFDLTAKHALVSLGEHR